MRVYVLFVFMLGSYSFLNCQEKFNLDSKCVLTIK